MGSMLVIVLSIFCFVILGIVIPIIRKHRETSNGVINYNADMTKFVYKVYANKEEIVRLLQTENIADEIVFQFDPDSSVVTAFESEGVSQKYHYEILEQKDYSILRLQKMHFIDTQSYIQVKLNPCIIHKLPAEPISFSQYGF